MSIFLAFLFSVYVDNMKTVNYPFQNYKAGTTYEYYTNLTNNTRGSWIVIPPEATDLTVYMTVTGTTNHGWVEIGYYRIQDLTNTTNGVIWDVGGVSISTNRTFIGMGMAWMPVCASNNCSFYAVSSKRVRQ